MLKNLTGTVLDKLIKNHKDNYDLPIVTDSAAISLVELETFIETARQKYKSDFDALRIHFVRFPIAEGSKENRICKAIKGGKLSQVSLVITPAKIKNKLEWTFDKLTHDNEEILSLTICDPDIITWNEDETGLVPPKASN